MIAQAQTEVAGWVQALGFPVAITLAFGWACVQMFRHTIAREEQHETRVEKLLAEAKTERAECQEERGTIIAVVEKNSEALNRLTHELSTWRK